jgi:hypothetical protein
MNKDILKMDDLEWLDYHWTAWYDRNGFVGEYFYLQMKKLGRSAKEIIKEMRDFQQRKIAG